MVYLDTISLSEVTKQWKCGLPPRHIGAHFGEKQKEWNFSSDERKI